MAKASSLGVCALRIVAEVLDGAAAVGVGVGLTDLGFGESGKTLEQKGTDGLIPGEVDELFVGLDSVGDTARGRQEEDEQR